MVKLAVLRLARPIMTLIPSFLRSGKATKARVEDEAVDTTEVTRVVTGKGTGKARLVEPSSGIVVAGSTVRLVFEYVVGDTPLPEGSRICFCFYHVCLWSIAQTHDPAAQGFVQATSSAEVVVKAWGDPRALPQYKVTQFPWHHVIQVTVGAGGIGVGERVVVTYGAGEARATAQPFAATPYYFRVTITPFGAEPSPAEEHPVLSVIGGPASRLVLVTPSDQMRGSGQVLARVEDVAGNLATGYSGSITVNTEPDAVGGAHHHRFEATERPVHLFAGVGNVATGVGRFFGRSDTGLAATSNPFRVIGEEKPTLTLWGELHGHSNLSDGYGTPEEYFAYARDTAGLDIACLTDHDFMLSDADWRRIKRASNAANEPGRFVTLQAYEWSGQTDVGGDRNLYFAGADPPIRRSRTLHDPINPFVYHGRQAQANHIADLYLWMDEQLGPEKVVMIPHVGGRPANPRFHDPKYEPLVEIFSEHRRSEDFVDGFRASGCQVGVVGGGDDHIGRPGNGFLISAPFDGGLGLVAIKSGLSRSEVFDALRGRRTYATSGARIIIDFEVAGAGIGSEVIADGSPRIAFRIVGTTRLDQVQVLRDGLVIYELAASNLGPDVAREWIDDEFDRASGIQSYWLRVTQVDGHVAVTSPVWVAAARPGGEHLRISEAHA